ncbi:MAG: SPOR domain-containing protein [Syntrophobacteraceae bacterium]
MIRPKLVVVNNDRDDHARSNRDGKGFSFELSKGMLVAYATCLLLSLCFLFTLGVLVGRGYSAVRQDDLSIKARFFRFLGLESQSGLQTPRASQTWEDPAKMIQSLDYYQDLTNVNRSPLVALSKPNGGSASAPSPQPVKEAPAEAAQKQQNPPATPAPQPAKPLPAAPPTGRYTLLVASLKESKARPLVARLQKDGYSPFVESLDLGSTKWSRILLGSFATRKAAITFADEFNRKEKTEAMVISGSK